MLSHVSNAVVQGGVGYTIIPGHLEFEGDQVALVFRPMHADEDHRRLSEDLVEVEQEFAGAVAYHAGLNHTKDCPKPGAGDALTAAVDEYSCFTVPVNSLLQQTSYALNITGDEGEEVEVSQDTVLVASLPNQF